MDQEIKILKELLDTVQELEQRVGVHPTPGHPSSVRKLQTEITGCERDIANGKLKGRALRRKSGELFRQIISLYPEIWKK